MTLVIIDFNRTLYDPESRTLTSGAPELLTALAKKGACMVLISRKEMDEESERTSELDRLGVTGFFAELKFVEEKTPASFQEVMRAHAASANCTFVIGDYIYDEIRAGNLVGAFTIHFKSGRFADLEPKVSYDVPSAVITSLAEAARYIA